MITFNNNCERRWCWWRRRRRWWCWLLCVVGSLLLEHTPSAPTTPNTNGKRLGQRACIGRIAQGQRGGGTRMLGVFENWARKCVLDFDLKTAVIVTTSNSNSNYYSTIWHRSQCCDITERERERSWAIWNDPPLYAHMPLPVLRSHIPGRRPRTPVKTGARVRRFQGCKKRNLPTVTAMLIAEQQYRLVTDTTGAPRRQHWATTVLHSATSWD